MMKNKQLIVDSEAMEKNFTDDSLDYVETNDIFDDCSRFIKESQKIVFHAIDLVLIKRNWLIGKRIKEEELKDSREENYGQEIVDSLSRKLTAKFGAGFARTNLYNFVDFYTLYKNIFHSVSGQSFLSWTHYRNLITVKDEEARLWYEREAIKGNWSVRTLKKNIDSLAYYRLLSTKNKYGPEPIDPKEENTQNIIEHIKDPLILDFVGLKGEKEIRESTLEEALISNLQQTLLELGRGFAFVGRQYRIHTDENNYFVDLVFYNYLLKCFVLFDLKSKKVTHQDIGQMDMYVRMFDELIKDDSDNPTVGIVLCSEHDADIAKYSFLNGNEHLFATKYKLYLPDALALKKEIEHQKELFEQKQAKKANKIK